MTCKESIKHIRTVANQKPLYETNTHHPKHAIQLRREIAATGKKMAQLTATELLAINHKVRDQLEASEA
jgi:hypothetical protein